MTKLRELRSEAGLTQEQLGAKVGVSRQAIIALENGKHSPSLDLAYRISAVLTRRVEGIFPNPYLPEAAE